MINNVVAAEKIPLVIEKNVPGAPQLLGIPFPKDKLQSSDHVRVLNSLGEEIPSQITIVNTFYTLNYITRKKYKKYCLALNNSAGHF